MDTAINLLVMASRRQDVNKPPELLAALQEGGGWDFVERRPGLWPGGCRLTVHDGKVQPDETETAALLRIARGRLGKDFVGDDPAWLNTGGPPVEIRRAQEAGRLIIYYAAVASFPWLGLIRRSSTGGFRLVTESEVAGIQDLGQFDKVAGVTDRTVIAMLPSEAAVLGEAFTHFAKPPPVS